MSLYNTNHTLNINMDTFWSLLNSKIYLGSVTIADIDTGITSWIRMYNNINNISNTSGFDRTFLISVLEHCQNAHDSNILMLTKHLVENHGATVATTINHACSQPLYWAVYQTTDNVII